MTQQPLAAKAYRRFVITSSHPVGTSYSAGHHTSTWLQTTLTRDSQPCPRRDSNPQSQRAAAEPRLRQRSLWDCPLA
jgi:hypothetical protein